MKMNWFFGAMSALGMTALMACGSSTTTTTTGGSSAGGGTANGGSAPVGCTSNADCITGGTCDTATGVCMDPTGTTCQQCACTDLLSMGGCADKCKMGTNGTTTPNFCDGQSALSQCKACLADKCGSLNIDPTNPSACQ